MLWRKGRARMTTLQLDSRPAKASSEWPCGTTLETAARYVASVRQAPSRAARLRAMRSREGLLALGSLPRQLPVVPAPFSGDACGQELRSWFRPDRRLPLDRAPVAVLALPSSNAEYLSGRPRQALRTNIKRATDAGVRCARVDDRQEVDRAVAHLAARRGQSADRMVSAQPRPGLRREFHIAYDSTGDPLALGEAIVDRTMAGVAVMVSATDHPDGPNTRYLLHADIVGGLIDRGVHTLTVGGSMLLTSAGTRYFQRRTGFIPARLRVLPPAASDKHPGL